MKLVAEPWESVEQFKKAGGELEFYQFLDFADPSLMPRAIGLSLEAVERREISRIEANLSSTWAKETFSQAELDSRFADLKKRRLVEANLNRLRELGSRRIGLETFLGEGYNAIVQELVYPGRVELKDGRILANPVYSQLDRDLIQASSSSLPEIGSKPNFARAFAEPPYSLRCDYPERQALFDQVLADLFPPGQAYEIYDWSSPDLLHVHDYFSPGTEWWGVHLYCVHLPKRQELTVILGSATD